MRGKTGLLEGRRVSDAATLLDDCTTRWSGEWILGSG
jgi:hypothetical protein